MKFSKEKDQEIVNLYLEGFNTVMIAKKFSTYNTSIRRVLLRNNIKLRTNSELLKFSDNNKFKNTPLSRESDYYLGLLIADGCISKNRLTLSLKEQDIYMLQSFASFLGEKVKVNKYFHSTHNKYQYEVKVRNESICDNLKKLAIFDNKSYDLKMLTKLNFDIIRGIIDGDGYLRTDKSCTMQICGNSLEFLKQIQDFYNQYNITSYIRKSRNLFSLSVHKQKDIIFLYNKLYYSTDLFLKRKKSKFGPLLKKFNSKNSINSGNFCQES